MTFSEFVRAVESHVSHRHAAVAALLTRCATQSAVSGLTKEQLRSPEVRGLVTGKDAALRRDGMFAVGGAFATGATVAEAADRLTRMYDRTLAPESQVWVERNHARKAARIVEQERAGNMTFVRRAFGQGAR